MKVRPRTRAARAAACIVATAIGLGVGGAGAGVAATPAATASGAYIVRPGDSLTAIAASFAIPLDTLARANRLDPAKPLLIGTRLTIPARWCPAEKLVVRSGDSLWTVAAKAGISRTRLAAANGLKPDALLILGATVTIPARPCPTATPVAAPAAAATPGAAAPAAASATPSAAAPAATSSAASSTAPAATGPALSSAGVAALGARLTAAIADPALPPSLTGVAVIDLRSGRTVFSQNASTPLAPASTEKLPLLVTALGLLGPGFRTHTDVLTAAGVKGGVLSGDIVLKGYGDPRLSVGDLAQLAATVRSLGVTTVGGAVIADESAFDTERIGPGWKAEFEGQEAPPLSALVVDGLAGPEGPAASAAVLFTKALRGAGVVVTGPARVGAAPAGARILATASGPSLSELAAAMGAWSDNYVAETTLKLVGLKLGGSGTTAAGAAVVSQRLATLGVPRTGVVIADGSGLSSLDRMPAMTLASLLAAAARDPGVGPTLRNSLSLAGVTGTLRRRLRTGAAAGIVHAKSGTTDPASALAGYVGDRYAFAIISNVNGVIDQSAAHAMQDRVVEALAENLSLR